MQSRFSDGADQETYHPDFMTSQQKVTNQKRPHSRLRVQVIMNQQGLIELDLSYRGMRDVPQETFNFLRLEVSYCASIIDEAKCHKMHHK